MTKSLVLVCPIQNFFAAILFPYLQPTSAMSSTSHEHPAPNSKTDTLDEYSFVRVFKPFVKNAFSIGLSFASDLAANLILLQVILLFKLRDLVHLANIQILTVILSFVEFVLMFNIQMLNVLYILSGSDQEIETTQLHSAFWAQDPIDYTPIVNTTQKVTKLSLEDTHGPRWGVLRAARVLGLLTKSDFETYLASRKQKTMDEGIQTEPLVTKQVISKDQEGLDQQIDQENQLVVQKTTVDQKISDPIENAREDTSWGGYFHKRKPEEKREEDSMETNDPLIETEEGGGRRKRMSLVFKRPSTQRE